MANKLTHAAERAAFQAVIKTAGRKTISNREEGFVSVVDMIQKINGDTWSAEAYDRLRETFGKDGKWTKFFNHLLDYADQDYLEGLFMSFGSKRYVCSTAYLIFNVPDSLSVSCKIYFIQYPFPPYPSVLTSNMPTGGIRCSLSLYISILSDKSKTL